MIIRDGGLSVKHELRDHSLGVVSVTLSLDGSRLASRLVLVFVLVPLNTQTKRRTDAVLYKVNPVCREIILFYFSPQYVSAVRWYFAKNIHV